MAVNRPHRIRRRAELHGAAKAVEGLGDDPRQEAITRIAHLWPIASLFACVLNLAAAIQPPIF
jgi:hypothetical protein